MRKNCVAWIYVCMYVCMYVCVCVCVCVVTESALLNVRPRTNKRMRRWIDCLLNKAS
jgi:hypothetical protein